MTKEYGLRFIKMKIGQSKARPKYQQRRSRTFLDLYRKRAKPAGVGQ